LAQVIKINPIAVQKSGMPFTVSGNCTWGSTLHYSDDAGGGGALPADSLLPIFNANWNFVHPGLPAGTHAITVRDTITGAIATQVVTVNAQSPITRNYYDIPGGDGCVWNTPLGSGCIWGAESEPDTQVIVTAESVHTNWYGEAIWVGGPDDPLIPCSGLDWWGEPVIANIHIPAGAYPAPPQGADTQLCLFDTTQPYRFWCFGNAVVTPAANQSNIQAGCTVTSTTSNSEVNDASRDDFGEDWETVARGAAFRTGGTNSGIGVITEFDLDPVRNPNGRIMHMLRYLCDSHKMNPGAGGAPTQILGPEAWPNYLQDWGAWITDGSEFNGYSAPPGRGLLPGVTIGIPQDVKITTLGLTPGGLMLARCLQEFGALFRDVSPGSGGIQYHADAKLAGNTLIAQMNADLPRIQRHVRPLRNQHRFGQDFATHPKNGPGARVAAPPPPLKIG
jgi:hypothetical protein